MKIETKHLVKRGVMGLSIACASLIMLGTSPVQAKGPVPAATKTEVKQTSLTEERINAVLKETYDSSRTIRAARMPTTSRHLPRSIRRSSESQW